MSPDQPSEPRQLVRSTNDKVLAGVCAGVAAYLQVPTISVRIAAVALAAWMTPPVIVSYIVAALALPAEDTPQLPLTVDWQANSLRVTWKGPFVPYVVSWLGALSLFAAMTAGTMLTSAVLGLALGSEGFTLAAIVHAPLLMLALVGGVFALVPRTYALTLSESALWVERPGQRARRIDLDDIEGFHPNSQPFTIHLKDGSLITLAPPPEGPELNVVVDELRRGIHRVEEHEKTLDAAQDERERLHRVAGAAAKAQEATGR